MAEAATEYLTPAEINRLKWRCRRGLLENDIFIERFFARYSEVLTPSQAEGVRQLMELSDPDLMDVLLARRNLQGEEATPEALGIVEMMRTPSPT